MIKFCANLLRCKRISEENKAKSLKKPHSRQELLQKFKRRENKLVQKQREFEIEAEQFAKNKKSLNDERIELSASADNTKPESPIKFVTKEDFKPFGC